MASVGASDMPNMPHIAIVGTGPAGEAAARVMLRAGARVTLLDEQPRTGGNIGRVGMTSDWTALEAMVRDAEAAALLTGAAVLAVHPPGRVTLDAGHGVADHDFDGVVLACGAYDLHHPVPGLPASGVSSAGALQALLKGQGLRPEGKVVLAGSGPFLYVVANGLLRAGVRVSHVVDRLTTTDYLRLALWGAALPANAWELAVARTRMLRAGTKLMRGRGIQRVAEAALTLDNDRIIAFDHLGFTESLIPQTQLARTAGCRLRFDRIGGYWVVDADRAGRSSAAGVYVCGEACGIRGWRHARVSGELAAGGLLQDYGLSNGQPRLARPRQRGLAGFGRALERTQRRREPKMWQPHAVICPCENVPVEAVTGALDVGLRDLSSIKVVTRCGMGPCQGRYCEPLVSRAIEARGEAPRAPLNQRSFTRPVTAGEVADGL